MDTFWKVCKNVFIDADRSLHPFSGDFQIEDATIVHWVGVVLYQIQLLIYVSDNLHVTKHTLKILTYKM